MVNILDIVIIGAGHSGLSIYYWLKRNGREPIIFEQDNIAENWRNNRWDSFKLVTPNWMLTLPGFHYSGNSPNGFLDKQEIIKHIENYSEFIHANIHCQEKIVTVEKEKVNSNKFRILSDKDIYYSKNVVVCTNVYNQPNLPLNINRINEEINVIHSKDYKNPEKLIEGKTLIIGNSQSGSQIANELSQIGKEVVVSTAKASWVPRNYCGKDIAEWLNDMNNKNKLPSSNDLIKLRVPSNPYIKNIDLLHYLNSKPPVELIGSCLRIIDNELILNLDVESNINHMFNSYLNMIQKLDSYANEGKQNNFNYSDRIVSSKLIAAKINSDKKFNLGKNDIKNIVFCTGYTPNFDWIKFPIFNKYGYPNQTRGVTEIKGLYFLGLPWLYNANSGIIYGIENDSYYVANHILKEMVS